jgi:hypothetical protein
MKSQGMQENQQVVFMSDGGENVRRVQEYLHPFSEHLLDWFHISIPPEMSTTKSPVAMIAITE